MIIEEKIKINISYRNITHYLKLEYNAIIRQILEVKVIDLPLVSHQKINIQCEICSKKSLLMYCKYITNKNRHGFYSCKSCSRQKAVLTSREIYGVDNYMMLNESKIKIANNNIKKYGVKTTLLEKNTKDKISKSMIEKYGTDLFYEIKKSNISKKFTFLNLKSTDPNIVNPSDRYKEIFDNTYLLYRREVRKLTKRMQKILYKEWNGVDYYDNSYIKNNFILLHNDPNYPTIDHKISIYHGFINNIPPSEIADISNLCITKRSINSTKRDLIENEFKLIN